MGGVVYLNEWLPNPDGPDAKGEFIELYNSSAAPASLNGWHLETEHHKRFALDGRTVRAAGYLVLSRGTTKLPLQNTNGALALYGPDDALVDSGGFSGTAPAGESFSRYTYEGGRDSFVNPFAFARPTPGEVNRFAADLTAIADRSYPYGVALDRPLDTLDFFAIMIGTAALVAGLLLYVITNNEDLSDLFFSGN